MSIEFEVKSRSAFAAIEGAPKKVVDAFAERLRPIEESMLADARSRALGHFHSVGAKPGLYLAGFGGGVKTRPSGVVAWMGNSNSLSHLFEYGFTISDMKIVAKDVNGLMKFAGDTGDVYRHAVHRHETKVQPYPNILPAFEARQADILEAAQQAAKQA